MISLSEARNDEIRDSQIRTRDTASSKNVFTRHYLATEGGSEVGFLSIDIIPNVKHFVIYEIFVPSTLRRRGVGTQLLEAAEKMADGLGYQSTLLVPKTLDQEFGQRALEDWYSRQGYTPDHNSGVGAFIKRL